MPHLLGLKLQARGGADADADLWFKARLECGPTLVLLADHVVDEELPCASAATLSSLRAKARCAH